MCELRAANQPQAQIYTAVVRTNISPIRTLTVRHIECKTATAPNNGKHQKPHREDRYFLLPVIISYYRIRYRGYRLHRKAHPVYAVDGIFHL